MSAIIKNISVPTLSSPVVLGINTGKKTSSTINNIYKSYSTVTTKNWYQQPGKKISFMDWDINQNELEFE